jgi:hypothetical protein
MVVRNPNGSRRIAAEQEVGRRSSRLVSYLGRGDARDAARETVGRRHPYLVSCRIRLVSAVALLASVLLRLAGQETEPMIMVSGALLVYCLFEAV